MIRHRETCRLCGSRHLSEAFSLTPTPPANAFVSESDLGEEQPCFPLDVMFCNDCNHVQLLDVVDPKILFRNYVYVSGTSPAFVAHFRDYASNVASLMGSPDSAFAVDIGSNDGTLLKQFRDKGFRILGVDPARDIAQRACDEGVETIPEFFDLDLADQIRASHGPADLVTANNIFAHADDLGGLTDAIRHLLSDCGMFVFEVSYLADVIEKTLFDTVYHEHLAYHSLAPLERFMRRRGLPIFKAERVDSHGGSIRVYAQPKNGRFEPDGSVEALIDMEKRMGLDRLQTFVQFADKIGGLRDGLMDMLRDIVVEGGVIAGFGAPAKATTLMYHFRLGPEFLRFIVDDNPLKQGLYSPGLHVPVLPSTALYDQHPECVVILAWNFATPIIANHERYLREGGRFLVPVPELSVHSA